MSSFNQDRFGIVFTISFIDFMLVVVHILANNLLSDEMLIALVLAVLVLSIAGYFSNRGSKSAKKPYVLTNRSYLLFFILGIPLGLIIRFGLGLPDNIDFDSAEPNTFVYVIPLALGGLAGFLFFTAMTMVVSVINIPYIRKKIPGDSGWIPFVGGVTLGFSIMIFVNLYLKGIPQVCC